MTGHLAAEELADHMEGLLPPADAAAADAHLTSCATCQALRDDLDAVRAVLAVDDPGPMPPDVAARIDAALAAEPAAPAPQTVAADTAAPAIDLAARRRTRARRWVRIATAAAGVAVFAGGAVVGIQVVRGGGMSAEQAGGGPPGSTLPSQPPVTASGRTYTADGFAGQVRALLRVSRGAAVTQPAPPPADGTTFFPADREGVTRCITALTGRPDATALTLDVGRWRGGPALVVALPDPADDRNAVAFVVGPRCTAGVADVLHRQVVRRP